MLSSFVNAVDVSSMYWVSIIVLLATLAVIVAWMLADASFRLMLDVILIDLGLRKHPGIVVSSVHDWSALGWRITLFTILAIAVIASIIAIGFLQIGNANLRTTGLVFTTTFILMIGVTMLMRYDYLCQIGFKWRLRRQARNLRLIAEQFADQWPTEDLTISPYGKFRTDIKHPWLLVAPNTDIQYPLHEQLGPFVRRNENGSILFDIEHPGIVRIEFHLNDCKPHSFVDEFGEFVISNKLDHMQQFEQGIYLTYYTQDKQSRA